MNHRQLTSFAFSFCVGLALAGCVTTSAQQEAWPEEIVAKTKGGCGSTYSLEEGDLAGSGIYVVGAFPEAERGRILNDYPTVDDIKTFMARHADLLQHPAYTLGTYCETQAGDCRGAGPVTCYLDISRRFNDLSTAAKLARACNQKSIARLGKDGVTIIEQENGRPFGNGQPLAGMALAACARARASR